MAPHQLIANDFANLIRFQAIDSISAQTLKYYLSFPYGLQGTLFQLSQIFSTYGYEPKAGVVISTNNTLVTGSGNRVYYVPPASFLDNNRIDTFTYQAFNGTVYSYPATVTIVSSTGAIQGYDFDFGSENWTIIGNNVPTLATYDPSSVGTLLNSYIYSSDTEINIISAGASDYSLWYFQAPSSSLGNLGMAYGGTLQFTLMAFAGDFAYLNADSVKNYTTYGQLLL